MIMINLLNGLPQRFTIRFATLLIFGWKENFGINFYDMFFSCTVDLKSSLDNHISKKALTTDSQWFTIII